MGSLTERVYFASATQREHASACAHAPSPSPYVDNVFPMREFASRPTHVRPQPPKSSHEDRVRARGEIRAGDFSRIRATMPCGMRRMLSRIDEQIVRCGTPETLAEEESLLRGRCTLDFGLPHGHDQACSLGDADPHMIHFISGCAGRPRSSGRGLFLLHKLVSGRTRADGRVYDRNHGTDASIGKRSCPDGSCCQMAVHEVPDIERIRRPVLPM